MCIAPRCRARLCLGVARSTRLLPFLADKLAEGAAMPPELLGGNDELRGCRSRAHVAACVLLGTFCRSIHSIRSDADM